VSRNEPSWEAWEHDIQHLLGLSATPASGAKWQAIGDAVDTGHPQDTTFPIIADCKLTEHHSFTISRKFWMDWQKRAAETGKRFILPLRIWPRGIRQPTDIVALSLDDFAELLEMARNNWTRLDEQLAQKLDEKLRGV